MFLRSFWYHYHADLITTSTAGVCYYLQDMGAISKLDASKNEMFGEEDKSGIKAWAEAINNSTFLTDLNIASNYIDAEDAKILGPAISDNGALSVTNVMGNRIGKEQLTKLQEIMSSKPNLVSLCGIGDDATEADLSGLGMDADDAAILASELPDKGARSVLSLKANMLATKEAGKVLAGMLKGNSVLKELDLSSNAGFYGEDGPGFAQELAVGIKDNGALSKLTFSGDQRKGYGYSKDSEPVTMCLGMAQAEFSNKGLGITGAIIVGAWITHMDYGSLLVLSLEVNYLRAEGGKALAAALKGNQVITELNVSYNELGRNAMLGNDPSGIAAIADAIPGMGAMTSLNLAGNKLGAEGTKIVVEAIKVTKCTAAIIFGSIFMSI
jgi:hypothetical protein